MSDPRSGLRAAYRQWLRVRADVRALATSLAAAEFALQRDARRTPDRDLNTLLMQLRAERITFDALAHDLDERIAEVKRDCAAIEARYLESMSTAARTGSKAIQGVTSIVPLA